MNGLTRGQPPQPGRSEAIRQLIELGLTVKLAPKLTLDEQIKKVRAKAESPVAEEAELGRGVSPRWRKGWRRCACAKLVAKKGVKVTKP